MSVLSDRYVLQSELGRGGMGVVWRATDLRLDREVAVKLLHPWIAEDGGLRTRFEREAATLAQLTHPHIVRVYDFEQTTEGAYLVMELIEGGDLSTFLATEGPLTWDRARELLAPVAGALAHAHARGVIHRDLTPANILIESESGRVLVTDFGLARLARAAKSLTATGVLIGTPEYWSPEQATGRDTDPATDLYSLGCVMFMMLSGRLPFTGDDRLALGLRRVHEDAPSLDSVTTEAPAEARDLVARLLDRNPVNRPTALDAADALTAHGAAPPLDVDPTDRPTVVDSAAAPTGMLISSSASRGRARRRVVAAATVALVGAAAVGTVLAVRMKEPSGAATPPARLTIPRFIGVTAEQAEKRLANAARKSGKATPSAASQNV